MDRTDLLAHLRLRHPVRRVAPAARVVATVARRAASALLRAPGPVRRMAFEAVVLLILARVLVRYVPMRHWRRRLNTGPPVGRSDAEGDRVFGHEVGRVVRKVASCLPFRVVCLPQAMAAQWMLRRRGVSSRLVFGVRRATEEPGGLDFHAWLTVAGENVVGDQGAETWAPFPGPTPGPDGDAPAPAARATCRR